MVGRVGSDGSVTIGVGTHKDQRLLLPASSPQHRDLDDDHGNRQRYHGKPGELETVDLDRILEIVIIWGKGGGSRGKRVSTSAE